MTFLFILIFPQYIAYPKILINNGEKTKTILFLGFFLPNENWTPGLGGSCLSCCDERPSGRKGLFQLITLKSHSITKGSQDRNVESGTEAEATEELMACSACHFYTTRDHLPQGGITHAGWALPQQSLIKKTPHILTYRLILWRHVLNWVWPFLDNASLCQSDQKSSLHSSWPGLPDGRTESLATTGLGKLHMTPVSCCN